MRPILIYLVLAILPITSIAGNNASAKSKIILCVGCHGSDGNSTSSENPILAGQGKAYLAKQIRDFKSGARKNETMSSLAQTINSADISTVVGYFSSQKRKTLKNKQSNNALGEKIYQHGIKSKGVTACASCHGVNGSGNTTKIYPSLAGQHKEYISKMLQDFRTGERKNDIHMSMRNIAAKLSDKEIELLSSYISALK